MAEETPNNNLVPDVTPSTLSQAAPTETAEATQTETAETVTNVVSEQTGQFDARFLLWRTFCAEMNISVDTLPSELDEAGRKRWEKMKDNQLHRPTEETPTPPISN